MRPDRIYMYLGEASTSMKSADHTDRPMIKGNWVTHESREEIARYRHEVCRVADFG